MSAVHGVYQALLSLKNIPTLEAAYKMVLGEMACALSSLTLTLEPTGRAPAPDDLCLNIQHPAFASLNLPLEKAQFTLIFNLSTLTTIGNTKNSLIGVSHYDSLFCWSLSSILNSGVSTRTSTEEVEVAVKVAGNCSCYTTAGWGKDWIVNIMLHWHKMNCFFYLVIHVYVEVFCLCPFRCGHCLRQSLLFSVTIWCWFTLSWLSTTLLSNTLYSIPCTPTVPGNTHICTVTLLLTRITFFCTLISLSVFPLKFLAYGVKLLPTEENCGCKRAATLTCALKSSDSNSHSVSKYGHIT